MSGEGDAAAWLRERAESYFSDARKIRDHAEVFGVPMVSEDEDAHWASVYEAISGELHKCAAEMATRTAA